MICTRPSGLPEQPLSPLPTTKFSIFFLAVVRVSIALISIAMGAPAQTTQQPATPPQKEGQAQPDSQQKPASQEKPPPQTPPQQQKPPNPFENVPQEKEAPKEQKKPETKPGAPSIQEAKPAPTGANIVEAVDFRGQRRVPGDTLRALISTRKGDVYSEEAIHRDFMSLWNTGRFDDLKVEKETGEQGGIIVRFLVTERSIVRTIDYVGNKSISKSEILDRFKERKVGLSPESQYDPGKVQRAKNVLQEYLAERGRQYATVEPELKQVPPSSVEIVYLINEGPKVKVGDIDIEGNKVFSDRVVTRAMKNLKPIGIPYSLLLEDLFPRTYDSTKLDEDSDRVRQFYQVRGYFKAHVIDRSTKIRDVGGKGVRIPLFYPNKPGKRVDVTMVIDEDQKYYLRNFNFIGMKLFRTPDLIAKQVFQMGKGDVFSTEKLQKGLDNLRKLYGDFGYIDFVPEPDPQPVPNSDQVDLILNVDEGKQFFVRRIDFQGNTTTRDKVIRREMLIDEGDLFSNRLWETSILRLNQLGFFDPIKAEEASAEGLKRDTKTNTVDLTLKVKERGKNSIQLNGGVSGIAGSFIGFSYATNNFLGLGETLSLTSQIGDRLKDITFGFSEPYLFDKPIQAGFTVYYQRFNYDQAREASIFQGQNLIDTFNSLGQQNLLNYVSNGRGFTTYMSYQLRRSFARVGLTYGYDIQNLTPLTESARDYFTYLNFQGVTGPNSLSGIKTSKVIPSYAYNTVDHPITPSRGKRLNITTAFSGLGGNVKTIEPQIDAAYFRRGIWSKHVMGFHLNASMIAGYGGLVPPPYSRYFMGGENDVRGFNIWQIAPMGYIPSSGTIEERNPDGTLTQYPRVDASGNPVLDSAGNQIIDTKLKSIPVYQFIMPGGDTKVVFNYEYRIPIFGPVTLAPFFDAGVNRLTFPSQLALNPSRISELNQAFPSADFKSQAIIIPGSGNIRTSVGLELQVLMPVVNAPFRLYWAYNPNILRTNIIPPFPNYDPAIFGNQATYDAAKATYATPSPFNEKSSTFRFSIGRTF